VLEIVDERGATAWSQLWPHRPPAAFRALDMRALEGFTSGEFHDCLFLSCLLTPNQAGFLTEHGATVIRDDETRPYTAHRAHLYTADELFAGFDPEQANGYASTFDARVYAHWVQTGRQYPPSISESLARRLHDHSISEALHDALHGARAVAIMGGHNLARAHPEYRRVAELSRHLTRAGNIMLSGGGPGAMEATHLGAWFASFADDDLAAALSILAPRAPGAFGGEYADPDWLHRAYRVRMRWPLPPDHHTSIGVPTWAYGHEPPAAFATRIAKYFANSVREDGLLAVATHGVVFTPGSAGTVQEIFQDATQNHYGSFGPPSPMVLLGREYWTATLPVWPLLQQLAERHDYRDLIVLTDDLDEVIDALTRYTRPGAVGEN
jgi:predicted Rossmann-fold nucleotide-binding protein